MSRFVGWLLRDESYHVGVVSGIVSSDRITRFWTAHERWDTRLRDSMLIIILPAHYRLVFNSKSVDGDLKRSVFLQRWT